MSKRAKSGTVARKSPGSGRYHWGNVAGALAYRDKAASISDLFMRENVTADEALEAVLGTWKNFFNSKPRQRVGGNAEFLVALDLWRKWPGMCYLVAHASACTKQQLRASYLSYCYGQAVRILMAAADSQDWDGSSIKASGLCCEDMLASQPDLGQRGGKVTAWPQCLDGETVEKRVIRVVERAERVLSRLQARFAAVPAPGDLITTAQAIRDFQTTAITIRRRVQSGRLQDCRPKGAAKNSALMLSRKELELQGFLPKPK